MSEPITNPIIVQGTVLAKGTELLVKGKRGRFRYIDASLTSTGKTVLNLVGPIGVHEHFSAVYLENVKRIYRKAKS